MSAKVKGGTMRWFYLKGLNTQYPLNPSVTSTKVPKVYRLTDKQAVGVKEFTDESFQTLELVTGEKVKTRTWKKEYKLLQVQKGFMEGEIVEKEVKEVIDGWIVKGLKQVIKTKRKTKPIEQKELNFKEITYPPKVRGFVKSFTRYGGRRTLYKEDYKNYKIKEEYDWRKHYYLDMESMFYMEKNEKEYWLVYYDNNNINHVLFKEWFKEFKTRKSLVCYLTEDMEILEKVMEEIYTYRGSCV